MNHDDDTPVQHSATERQLRHLVVPEAAAYANDKRLDLIQQPAVNLLWAKNEYSAFGPMGLIGNTTRGGTRPSSSCSPTPCLCPPSESARARVASGRRVR